MDYCLIGLIFVKLVTFGIVWFISTMTYTIITSYVKRSRIKKRLESTLPPEVVDFITTIHFQGAIGWVIEDDTVKIVRVTAFQEVSLGKAYMVKDLPYYLNTVMITFNGHRYRLMGNYT